jgi:hypothetical protein
LVELQKRENEYMERERERNKRRRLQKKKMEGIPLLFFNLHS